MMFLSLVHSILAVFSVDRKFLAAPLFAVAGSLALLPGLFALITEGSAQVTNGHFSRTRWQAVWVIRTRSTGTCMAGIGRSVWPIRVELYRRHVSLPFLLFLAQ